MCRRPKIRLIYVPEYEIDLSIFRDYCDSGELSAIIADNSPESRVTGSAGWRRIAAVSPARAAPALPLSAAKRGRRVRQQCWPGQLGDSTRMTPGTGATPYFTARS